MTGEIPYYGTTGRELWSEFSRMIADVTAKRGIPVEVSAADGAWTGVSFPGRGRVLQARVNGSSLRCYPLGVQPQDRFAAIEHEASKCSKSWKRRFPSMFTIDGPEQLPLALDLVDEMLVRVATEEPVQAMRPLMAAGTPQ
jgi:hypothetical protein